MGDQIFDMGRFGAQSVFDHHQFQVGMLPSKRGQQAAAGVTFAVAFNAAILVLDHL